jgi:hypothetical protein
MGGIRVTSLQKAHDVLELLAFGWKSTWMEKMTTKFGTVIMGHLLLHGGV